MSTIVLESRQTETGMLPKVSVFVNGENKSESLVEKSEEIQSPPNRAIKGKSGLFNENIILVLPTLQNPAANLPWQLPGFTPSNRVVKYGTPEKPKKPNHQLVEPVISNQQKDSTYV